jgi:hypothetical protein
MANCPNGHENPDGYRFCGECGERLVTDLGSAPEASPDAAPVQGRGTGRATVPLSAERARDLLHQLGEPEPPATEPAATDDWVSRGRRWLSVRRNQFIAGGVAAGMVIIAVLLASSGGSRSTNAVNSSSTTDGGAGGQAVSSSTTPTTRSGSVATVTAATQSGDTANLTFDVADSPTSVSSSAVASEIGANCQGLESDRATVVSVYATITLTSHVPATVKLGMAVDNFQSSSPAYFLYHYSNGWQCIQAPTSQVISYNQPDQQGGTIVAQIWYVIPNAITPNSSAGNQAQLFVRPQVDLANQVAALQGSGSRWATCRNAVGGNVATVLIVAGGSALDSHCTA